MIIKPKIRGFICTNAHPLGCAANVKQQISYVQAQGELHNAPKNVLVIGCSPGYGLASRITAAFAGGAKHFRCFVLKNHLVIEKLLRWLVQYRRISPRSARSRFICSNLKWRTLW